MRYLYILLSLLFLWSCGNSTQQTEVEKTTQLPPKEPHILSAEKEAYLNKVDLLRYPDEIFLDLNGEGITLKDVEAYSHKNDSLKRESALIMAMASGFENNVSEANSDYWGGILYDMENFISIVRRLKADKHTSFMDIGSGNGSKIYAALCMGFEEGYGLEYAPELVEISNQFLEPYVSDSIVRIQLGNALTVDSSYYAQADFLYMYSPIKSHETMAFLYERAMQNMKEGAIFLEVRFVYAKELRERTQLSIPDFPSVFAIQKNEGNYYYLRFDQEGTTEKVLLEPITNTENNL